MGKDDYRRFIRLMQREGAEHYLFLTLLSFAASVTLTRLFLSLADYPQLGGGELHIAHAIWGGLLLYVAALLPLLFANRGIYTISALLAGIGVGLFIDEVGKFITQRNDYFFPVAASIIYVFFLLTIVLLLHVRRVARAKARDELARVFEDIWEMLHHPPTSTAYMRLKARLEIAAKSAPSQRHANLANALLKFLDADETPTPLPSDGLQRPSGLAKRIIARLFPDRYLRVYLIFGLLAIGLLTLKNPFSILLAPWLPPDIAKLLTSLYIGRHIEATTAPLWFSIRLGLEVIVGALLLASAGLLVAKRNRPGTAVGFFALLLSLTTVSILLFYFEQFSTVATTTIQFLLIIGVVVYRRHTA